MQCLAELMLLYTSILITLDFSLNLNLRRLLTQCYHTRKNTVKYIFCVFSLEKPLGFLSRGTINSLKVFQVKLLLSILLQQGTAPVSNHFFFT